MEKVNNAVVFSFFLITLSFGVAVFLVGINISINHRNQACDVHHRSPLFAMGYLIIVMSILGLCRNYCSVKVLRWLYLMGILSAIMVIAFMVGFGIMVMGPGSEDVGKSTIRLRPRHYSPFLQRDINKRWSDIKACMIRADICIQVDTHSVGTHGDVIRSYMAYPLQRSCCMPSFDCGFGRDPLTFDWHRVNRSTAAAAGLKSLSVNNPDCNKWDNDWSRRCFDCDSCKAGFMGEMVWSWKRNFLMETGFLTCLVLIFGISLRATFSRNGDNDEEGSCNDSIVHNLSPKTVAERD